MVYSNLRMAFIYQLIVGIICVLAMLLNGEKIFILVALMAFRPFVLDRKTVQDLSPYWRFYNQINKISFVITAISLIIFLIFYHLLGNLAVFLGLNLRFWLMVLYPCFLIVQGTIALTYLKQSGIS